MLITVLARLMGFLRDTLIAYRFGASHVTDAYVIAYMVPTFLNAVIAGSLNSVVVPRVTEARTVQGEEASWGLVSSTYVWVFLSSLAVSSLLAASAPLVVQVLAPGFGRQEHRLTAELARILVWTVLFSNLGYLSGSILNAYRRFAFAAVAPMMVSGTAVLSLAFLPHPNIETLAWAIFCGAALQFLLETLPVARMAFRHRLRARLREPELGRMGKLSFPILISSSVSQANVIVDRIFGSALSSGSITALSFADRVVQVPLGVFGQALSTAIFPELSEAWARTDDLRFRRLLTNGLLAVFLITIPITGVLLVFALPVIALLFHHGAFSLAATRLTAGCLAMYALALIPYSANVVIQRAYFVLEETFFIGISSLLMLLLNALLDWAFVGPLGAPGLALSTSVVQWTFMVLLIVQLRRRHGPLGLRRVLLASGKALVATVPAVLIGTWTLRHVGHLLVLRLLAAVLATGGVYLALAYLFGLQPTFVLRRSRAAP